MFRSLRKKKYKIYLPTFVFPAGAKFHGYAPPSLTPANISISAITFTEWFPGSLERSRFSWKSGKRRFLLRFCFVSFCSCSPFCMGLWVKKSLGVKHLSLRSASGFHESLVIGGLDRLEARPKLKQRAPPCKQSFARARQSEGGNSADIMAGLKKKLLVLAVLAVVLAVFFPAIKRKYQKHIKPRLDFASGIYIGAKNFRVFGIPVPWRYVLPGVGLFLAIQLFRVGIFPLPKKLFGEIAVGIGGASYSVVACRLAVIALLVCAS